MKKEMERGTGKRRKARGSTNNGARLDHFTNRRKAGFATWETCDPGRLHSVVDKITSMGGAVTIGLSRDKGAHFVTLLLDDEKATMWYNGDANLDDALDDIAAGLKSLD